MKKNVLMRAASGLLVATMLTTCAISGTFAKYVTQDNGGDVARVAKWGVVTQVQGDLYALNYLDGNVNTESNATDHSVSVSSQQGLSADNVVAPGTKSDGNVFAFNLNGTPEVDSKTTIKITAQNIYLNEGEYGVMVPVDTGIVTAVNFADMGDLYFVNDSGEYEKATGFVTDTDYFTLEDYVNNAEIYYPVIYQMAGEDTTVTYNDLNNDGPQAIKKDDTLLAIANKILGQVKNAAGEEGAVGTVTPWAYADGKYTATATSAIINHNTDLETVFALQNQSLSWEWEFHDENGEVAVHDTETHHISQQDKLDTILGNLMAERLNTNDDDSDVDFNGEVVKKTGDIWKAPVKVAADQANDYCLDTMFDICILTEQVD